MKKVINCKTYNTETATLIGEWWNGYSYNDFNFCKEKLFVTKKGAYFIFGDGGAYSKYSESYGNTTCGSSDIIAISKDEAYKWAEENLNAEDIEKHFSEYLEDA